MKLPNPTVQVQISLAFAESRWNGTRALSEAEIVQFISARYLGGADPTPTMLDYYRRVIAALARNGGLVRSGDAYRRPGPAAQMTAAAAKLLARAWAGWLPAGGDPPPAAATPPPAAPTPEEALAAIGGIGRSHPDSVYLGLARF